MPDISVLIVAWNSSAQIGACLDSLVAGAAGRTLEVIVVDNGSIDGTAELVLSRWPQARLIRTGRNLGFAPAMNIALSSAIGNFVLWLNPDTRVTSAAIDLLAGYLESHPEAGAAGPLLLDESGARAQFSARQFPSLTNAFLRHFGLRWAGQGQGFLGQETFSVGNTSLPVDCLCGAAIMMSRQVYRDVGPLDTTMPMYFEDLDYCARIAATGRTIVCVPSAVMVHEGARSTEQSANRPLLHAMEDGHAPFLYIKKYNGPIAALVYRAIVLSGNLVRAAFLSVWLPGRPGHSRVLRQKAWNLAHWGVTPSRLFEDRIIKHFAPSISKDPKAGGTPVESGVA